MIKSKYEDRNMHPITKLDCLLNDAETMEVNSETYALFEKECTETLNEINSSGYHESIKKDYCDKVRETLSKLRVKYREIIKAKLREEHEVQKSSRSK